MLKIVRGQLNPEDFKEDGWFLTDNIRHQFNAALINTNCIVVGEFKRWRDIKKHLAIACAFDEDIHIDFIGPQEGLDVIGFYTLAREFCQLYNYEIKVSYLVNET